MLAFTISINILSSSQNNYAANEKKGIHIGKEEAKLSLFKDDIQLALSNTGLNYEDALIHGRFSTHPARTNLCSAENPRCRATGDGLQPVQSLPSVAGPETHPRGIPRDDRDLMRIKSQRFRKKLLRLIKKFSRLQNQ